MAKFEYKIIDVRGEKGHNQAVKLQAKGWKVIAGSLYGVVTLEKETKKI